MEAGPDPGDGHRGTARVGNHRGPAIARRKQPLP